ncbi:MAG: phage major capsid protein [candidate division NC10 bacterium]|nr:phage major capsid protein [candidate division NC10 bacterium]
MTTRFADVLNAIKDMGDAFEVFKETNDNRLNEIQRLQEKNRDRLEEVESKGTGPGKTGTNPPLKELGHKVYHTEHGPIYELPHNVKMQDVLPPAKEPEISFERWLAATMAGERCGDKAALEFARERKQLVTTTGGVLIPEEFQSRWVDLVRAAMVLNGSGMRTVTMDAKTQTHSAVLTDPAVTWHTEAGSISVGNPTFALRQLVAKTLVVRCQGSVELAQDSPDFGSQLGNVMTRAIAAEIDRVGLVGSGTPPEPQGILGTTGVGQVLAVGTPTEYAELITGIQTLLGANVPLEVATANAIMSPRTWATYEGLVTGLTSDKTQLPRPRALRDTAFRVTTSVPNNLGASSPPNESVIVLGDFRDLILGVRRESAVEALKLTTYASNLLVEFVGFTRIDFLVTRPSSFVTLEGVTP